MEDKEDKEKIESGDGTGKKYAFLWLVPCVLTVVSIIVMYRTHRAVPFMMDDLWYSTKLSSDTPIASLGDIIDSQVWHYFNWGGRSLTHGILQLTLLAGEQAADILNVAVTLLLGGVICLVSGAWGTGENVGRACAAKGINAAKGVTTIKDGNAIFGMTGNAGEYGMGLFALWAAVSMLLGLNANWKMSMFWQAGAANYLYITVFILLFLYCYLREIEEPGRETSVREALSGGASPKGVSSKGVSSKGASPKGASSKGASSKGASPKGVSSKAASSTEGRRRLPGITLWIIPLGILAGWSNENMGPAVWLTSLVVIFMMLKEHKKVRPWMALGNLSCLAGSIVMIAAPGNFVRNAQVPENQYGLLWRCFLRCYGEGRAAMEYLFPTLAILAVLLVAGRGILKLPLDRKEGLLLFCALLSWGAMILSPHYPDRASFGTQALLICVILSQVKKILGERRELLGAAVAAGMLVWLRGMFFLGEFLAISWGWIR